MSKPITKIELDTSFIKIGNKVYTLQEATHPILNTEKMLEKYANNKVRQVCEEISTSAVTETKEEMNRQTERLDKWLNAKNSRILLPPNLISRVVMYQHQEWLVFYPFTYCPNRIRCSIVSLQGKIEESKVLKRVLSFCTKGIEGLSDTAQIDLYLTSNYRFPAMFGVAPKTARLYVKGVRGFHNYGDGSTCTGNMPIKEVKALNYPKAVSFLNSINTFSMASRRIDVYEIDQDNPVNQIDFTQFVGESTLDKVESEAVWTTK